MLIQREPIGWKIKIAFRKLLSQVVLWVSVAIIAMIAVPTSRFGTCNNGNMAAGGPYPRKARKKGRTNIKYFVKDYESVLFDLR